MEAILGDDAEALAELLGDPSPDERLVTAAAIARHVGMRTRIGPPDDTPGPVLLVGHAAWWVGPRGGACAECGRLVFAEEWFGAGEAWGDGVTASAIVLSPLTLARMREAVATPATGAPGWIVGDFSGARVVHRRIAHAACHPVRRRSSPASSPADAARSALRRLGVRYTETLDRGRRDRPMVLLSWHRACRDSAGAWVVHAGVQVGAGAAREERVLTARAETIERVLVGTRAPDVRDRTPAELGDRALDPREWGRFAPEQYASPGFPHLPVTPDTRLHWVEARDLGSGRPILVPLDLVHGDTGRYLPASSTGCAAHTSLDAVVIRGLLEVMEREALQVAWYGGRPALGVPPERLHAEAASTIAWIRAQGWDARLGYAPGRAGRHVVCAVGARPGGGSIFTSGASGRFAVAIDRALRELVTAAEVLGTTPVEEPAGVRTLLDEAWRHDDPAPIQRLYLHPAMRPVLDAWLAGPPLAARPPDRDDTVDDLVGGLVAEGLRPLYVDCTVPGSAPFHAGKVIVAGALQHSFATGRLRVGAGPFAPPARVLRPPPPGFRFLPGRTTPWPFPLG